MSLFTVECREKFPIHDDLVVVDTHIAYVSEKEQAAVDFIQTQPKYSEDDVTWWWVLTNTVIEDVTRVFLPDGTEVEYEPYEPSQDVLTLLSQYRIESAIYQLLAEGCSKHPSYRAQYFPPEPCKQCEKLWRLHEALEDFQLYQK